MSKNSKFVAIGHISNDLLPYPHLNGTVINAAIVARNLGYETNIITKAPSNHPYLEMISKLGIKITNLPVRSKFYQDKITSFKNIFNGVKRSQSVTEQQESITLEDLNFLPELSNKSIVLYGPLLNEIEVKIIKELQKNNFTAITAQGFLRDVEKDGKVWKRKINSLNILSFVDAVILSDEDISFNNSSLDVDYLRRLITDTKILALTRNKRGSEIYKKSNINPIKIEAFPLEGHAKYDYSGAGDVYAASFILAMQNKPLIESASFASLYSTIKIYNSKKGRIGIDTIPTIADIEKFIAENKNDIYSFCEFNKISLQALLEYK